MSTQSIISELFDRGVQSKSTHMIVVCDTFDYEYYPVYVGQGESFWDRFNHYNGQNMQRVMEVYDLSADKAEQFAERRAWSVPK